MAVRWKIVTYCDTHTDGDDCELRRQQCLVRVASGTRVQPISAEQCHLIGI